MLAASGLEEEFLARAQPMDVGSAIVPVIAVDDLIVAKVLAGRAKDPDDARRPGALGSPWGDDASRIRGILQLLEEALSQSDPVPAFDAIVRPAR